MQNVQVACEEDCEFVDLTQGEEKNPENMKPVDTVIPEKPHGSNLHEELRDTNLHEMPVVSNLHKEPGSSAEVSHAIGDLVQYYNSWHKTWNVVRIQSFEGDEIVILTKGGFINPSHYGLPFCIQLSEIRPNSG